MKIRSVIRKIFAVALLSHSIFAAHAQYSRIEIPDSAAVRTKVRDSWLKATVKSLNGRPSEIYNDPAGGLFQVRSERIGQSIAVAVMPQTYLKVSYIRGDDVEVVDEPSYSLNSCGSWILFKNRNTGADEKIIIRFTENPDIYLQLKPLGKGTTADLIAYDSYLAKGKAVGIPFENLYTISFPVIQRQCAKTIPWDMVLPAANQYGTVQAMISVIRDKLPSVSYAEDAAYNEDGKLYSIEKGNDYKKDESDKMLDYYLKEQPKEISDQGTLALGAPGFVKWIVDGIIYPMTGKLSRISDLVMPTTTPDPLSKQGVLSSKWNMTLNLDWNRHLAEKVTSLRSVKGKYSYETGGTDVNDNFFISEIQEDGRIVPSLGYTKNVGYESKRLLPLLYVLAATEPDWFYIGAIRHTSSITTGESVFDGNAAFFPYFRDDGKFDCVVFQNGKELTIRQFITNNPNAYVHLERIKSYEGFDPQ